MLSTISYPSHSYGLMSRLIYHSDCCIYHGNLRLQTLHQIRQILLELCHFNLVGFSRKSDHAPSSISGPINGFRRIIVCIVSHLRAGLDRRASNGVTAGPDEHTSVAPPPSACQRGLETWCQYYGSVISYSKKILLDVLCRSYDVRSASIVCWWPSDPT